MLTTMTTPCSTIYYQLLTNKIGFGYKSKNGKKSSYKIVELKQEKLEYEKPYENSKEILNQNNLEHEMLSLERLFSNVISSNMVDIKEISNEVLKKVSFNWYGNDEFESLSFVSLSISSSYFMVDENTADFTLISKQPIIQDFKYIDTILQTSKYTINATLKDQHLGEDEEYNINDKNWILILNQLEEGSHMLIKKTIKVDLSDDPNNPKIIQLRKSLTKDER